MKVREAKGYKLFSLAKQNRHTHIHANTHTHTHTHTHNTYTSHTFIHTTRWSEMKLTLLHTSHGKNQITKNVMIKSRKHPVDPSMNTENLIS